MKENTDDPIVSKILDSPISRPVKDKSPVLPARQKTSLEKTTGYDSGVLRRERGVLTSQILDEAIPCLGLENAHPTANTAVGTYTMLSMNSTVNNGNCVTPRKFISSREKASAEKKSMMRKAVFHADRSSSGLVSLTAP